MKIRSIVLIVFCTLVLLWSSWEERHTSLGQWSVPISNFGRFGWDAFWPRSTANHYIYGSGMWYGSIAPNGDTLVTVGYDPHSGFYEFAPGLPYSDPLVPEWHVHFSHDFDKPLPIFSLGGAFAQMNDFDIAYHMAGDTRPTGITVTQTARVWPKYWADDLVFLEYKVKNDTNYTINNLYAGFCMDFDIGNEAGTAANDRMGIDLGRKLFYGWQEEYEPGWTGFPGRLGLKLLDSYPLAAFKRFTLGFEPNVDWQRYMTLTGYNYTNGAYEPFDTIWPPPDDQRMLMSTGPFDISPGDSIVFNWALIASHDSSLDTIPGPEMEYKADKAQILFNTGLHTVNIVQPNGGEVISGTYPIDYSAVPITPNPLAVDIYLFSEHGIDTVALGQSNTGSYSWNTTSYPDGVLNRIAVMAYDTVTFGCDASGGFFTIDNPGNAPPVLWVITPWVSPYYLYDTLTDICSISWFARDPEFGDSVPINIFFKGDYESNLHTIALNETNDSLFDWYTRPFRNGPGMLIVQTTDGQYTVAETVKVYLLNEVPGGPMNPIGGLNNCVNLDVLIHFPGAITGHTYELEFLEYKKISGVSRPEYFYTITDTNTGMVVLDSHSLKNGYYGTGGLNDYSPIVDGFSIWSYTDSSNTIRQANFHNDSVIVMIGTFADSIYFIPTSVWWAYRGARLQMDWILKAGGGLSLQVIDLDYGDTIPYKPYNRLGGNADSAFGWCFSHNPVGAPSDTFLPNYTDLILVCGEGIRISGAIIPQVGDQWVLYPSGYSPPIKGNVYHFTPVNAINERKTELTQTTLQVFPVPSSRKLTIDYVIPEKQNVTIVIYDILGRFLKRLASGMADAGLHRLYWDCRDDLDRKVPSGIYFCRFETRGFAETRKIIVLR